MKVIKQLKRQTPEIKLKKFLQQMPIITKIILISYTFIGLISLIVPSTQKYSLWLLFTMRFSELILLNLFGISDLKRQQGKGSFYIIISFLLKNLILLTILFLLNIGIQNWPKFTYLINTSIIIQYLFLIMIQDALKKPHIIKYIIIQPFQIKSRFYPIFFFIFLMLGGIRVDLLVPITLGVLLYFIDLNNIITKMSNYFDQKLVSDGMINIGFLKTGSEHRIIKNMDEMVTSDSVILQQK